MTRPLHPETQVQRGDDAAAVSREACERGFEPQDAPTAKVAIWVGAVLVLMVIGLAFTAGLSTILLRAEDRPRDPSPQMTVVPPSPRLLADPPVERRLIENVARIDEARLRRAMQSTAQAGWGENAPAPAPQDAVRGHVEAAN